MTGPEQKRQRQEIERSFSEVAAAWSDLMESGQAFTEALGRYDAVRYRNYIGTGRTDPYGPSGAALITILGAVIGQMRNYIEGIIGDEEDASHDEQ